MGKTPKKSDFNPDELTQKTDKHEQDITRLFEWAGQMEANFGNHEKIAKTLHAVAQTSVEMNTMLKETLISLVQNDPDVKFEVKKTVESIDRNVFRSLIQKIGFGFWTLLVSLISGTIVFFIKK